MGIGNQIDTSITLFDFYFQANLSAIALHSALTLDENSVDNINEQLATLLNLLG